MATSMSDSAAETAARDRANVSRQLRSRRRACFAVVTGELADALDVASLADAPGCWDRAVDAHWSVSVNAHATEMQSELLQLPVPPGHVVVKYNGWLAGLVDAFGTGEFGFGGGGGGGGGDGSGGVGGATENDFIAAVRAAVKSIGRERVVKKPAVETTSSATAVAPAADEKKTTREAAPNAICRGRHIISVRRRPCLGAECVALVCYVCANRPVFAPPYCGAKCQPACAHERKPCERPGCLQTACADCDASRYCSWVCADNAFDAVA